MARIINFLIILSSLLIVIFYSIQVSNKKNDIDFLEESFANFKAEIPSREVYFISNNRSQELYFKAQFMLAPKIVLNRPYVDIPYNSSIILTYDQRNREQFPNPLYGASLDTIRTDSSTYFKSFLLRKK